MRRRRLLAGVGCLLVSIGCGPRVERVVLVTIDTLRADHVGAYGAARASTPTLDALAAAGVRFETAIAPTPLTLPSHASLMTALEPHRHGVRHNAVFRLEAGLPTLAERLGSEGWATAAFVSAFVLDRGFGLARGFDHYDDRMEWARWEQKVGGAQRRGDATVEAALAWLETAPERFFLWVHLYDPHWDYEPPAPFRQRFRRWPYAGEVAFADAQTGRLLAALDARFDPEQTLVVVTSDHGESLGDHGEATHSYFLYEATQRVPLLVRGPGLPSGAVVHELVRLVDVAPTLLALADRDPLPSSDGRSLLPLLRRERDEPRRAHLETLAPRLDYGWSPLLGLRTARHKYLRAPRPELYDLTVDPRETRNLAGSEPALAAQLDAWLEEGLAASAPLSARPPLGAEDRARLESLGYVVPDEAAAAGDPARVEGRDPKDGVALLQRLREAHGFVEVGQPAQALAHLDAVAESGFEIEVLRAHAALLSARPGRAEQAARAAVASKPGDPAGHEILGRCLEDQGHLDAAEAAFRAAERLGPEQAAPLVGLGRLAEARGDPARAEALYSRALERRVPSSEAAWRLAALRIEQSRLDEARAALDAVDPAALREPGAAVRLAEAYGRAGRLETALAFLEGASASGGERFARVQRTRAALLERAGRLDQALAVREQVLALRPRDPAARNDVAWSLTLLERDLDRALELAQSVVAETDSLSALDTLATVRLRRGETAAALAVAERALPVSEGALRTHLLLVRAEALAKSGRRDEARAALDEASARLDPGERGSWADATERVRASLATQP